MDTEIISSDQYGGESYKALYEEVMFDSGKQTLVDKSVLVLRPEIPFFIFSVRLKSDPVSKKISDVATTREENGTVHLAITDENYAPEILDRLWKRYGRAEVQQQSRLDITVDNASEADIDEMPVASGEESIKEVIGTLWRIMPEGMKNRHTFTNGKVITVMATEERTQPSMLEEAEAIHRKMCGEEDV
jgi:putative methanogenesis marker protein 17